jgi:UMF1 family MFS transporter
MRRMSAQPDRRAVRAWVLYDVGNSAFATTVMAGFFPVFFKQYWSAGDDPTESTFRLGLTSSLASLVVALLAPVLGALGDQNSWRKRLLAWFAVLGALSTLGLAFVAKGDWLLASILFGLATVGFACSIVFYDALLVAVAAPGESHRVSSLGYAMGYLGGGLLFAVNVAMTQKPALFGLADAGVAVRVSFAMVGVWWLLFLVPLLRRVPEPAGGTGQGSFFARIGPALSEVGRTIRSVRQTRGVWLFLLAYWLYIDGVDTVIRMAVDYGLSIGLPSSSLIIALLIVQFVGFPSAIAIGKLAGHIGEKRAILLCLTVYVGVTVWGAQMTTAKEFYVLAIAIGLAQGGVQALSRSLWSQMVPPERAAELFGFYNMLGKMAAIVGPVLMGAVALATGSTRISILSITVLFFAGGLLLTRVPTPQRPPHAR